MDLGAIFVLLAVLVGVGLFLAAPLMRRLPRGAPQAGPETSSLLAERDRVINALQELDFDFKLGKIPDEDYPAQRAILLQRGADILRRLDELQPTATAGRQSERDASAQIEQAAAAGRADAGAIPTALTDDRIESMLAARRAARMAKSAGFCPRCGRPVLVSDKFCPNCGKALQ
jgi:NADH pyrophosphatase NudC (nudix superfamily)